MSRDPLLIVDDEETIRWSLRQELQPDYEIIEASSVREAIDAYQAHQPVATVLDLKLPDGSGLDVLTNIRTDDADAVVIIMTAFSDVETAIQAIRLGAHEYLKKPFDLREIRILLEKATETARIKRRAHHLQDQARRSLAAEGIVGSSPAIERVRVLVQQAAEAPSTTVLLQGESGVGKGVVAKAIHMESPRAREPFIEVSCPAIPHRLMENELVGHERGAFTDAKTR